METTKVYVVTMSWNSFGEYGNAVLRVFTDKAKADEYAVTAVREDVEETCACNGRFDIEDFEFENDGLLAQYHEYEYWVETNVDEKELTE